MVTDEERREVATRLRANAKAHPHMGLLLNLAFADKGLNPDGEMEYNVTSYHAALRLADLIEPEPKRTCRVVTDKNTVSQTQDVHTKCCSECSYVFGREQHRQLLPGLDEEFVLHAVQIPDYCPNCGAKVVEE